MDTLKTQLLSAVGKTPGVKDRQSPVVGGTALFYFGQELAHSHSDNPLDLQPTKRSSKLNHLVPLVESEEEIFLKTIMPSRKATKLYLREVSNE